MNKYAWLLVLVVIFCMTLMSPAFAAPSDSDPIWSALAGKAHLIGQGLKRSGYIIAGIGLIFFAFMAIFNKISWKNFAYIALSCFVLTFMIALINWFSSKGNHNPATENTKFTGAGAADSTDIKGGVPSINAEKKG